MRFLSKFRGRKKTAPQKNEYVGGRHRIADEMAYAWLAEVLQVEKQELTPELIDEFRAKITHRLKELDKEALVDTGKAG